MLYVRDGMRHKEFYEYGLVAGIHYVSVDTADDVPDMVRRWLGLGLGSGLGLGLGLGCPPWCAAGKG